MRRFALSQSGCLRGWAHVYPPVHTPHLLTCIASLISSFSQPIKATCREDGPFTHAAPSQISLRRLAHYTFPQRKVSLLLKCAGKGEKNNNKEKAWLIAHTLHHLPLNLSIPMCHENQREFAEIPAAGSVFPPSEQWIMGATSLQGFAPAHNVDEWFSKKGNSERYFLNEISKDVKVQVGRCWHHWIKTGKASSICCFVYLPTSTSEFGANVELLIQQLWPTWGWRCACMFVWRWAA